MEKNHSLGFGLHLVLVEPQIPQNTGAIARLAAATHSTLHLIEPLGFKLGSRFVRRAGLDYWPEVRLETHLSWDSMVQSSGVSRNALWFFTTKSSVPYTAATFHAGDFLVFGSETAGLSEYFHSEYQDRRLTIPMDNPRIRSLNLAMSVGIVLYEARRQIEQSPIS